MRRLKLFFACLLTAILSIGQVWGAINTNSTWTATALGSIPEGSTVIIINANGKAISNATVTKAPAKIEASYNSTTKKISVSTTGKTLDDIAWTTEDGTNGTKFWVYGSTTNLLGLSKLNDNNAIAVNVATTAIYSEFVMGANGNLLEAMNGENRGGRFVGEYVSGSDWRSYNSEAANNYKSGSTVPALTFYVLDAGDPPTPTTCETPTFDPEDGETFTESIEVEITSTTTGSAIYYTLDESTPTSASTLYEGAIELTATTTIKAIAIKDGLTDSEVASATFTKVEPFAGSILEIVKGDFTTTSYDDNAGDHEKDGVTFTTAKVYQSGSSIQFQKTNGLLYNKTDLVEIVKIEITTYTGKANNLVVYEGTSENPSSTSVAGSASGDVTTYSFDSGNGFFAIKCNGTGASNVDPIKIYYTSTAPTVAKPTISGNENFVTSTTVTLACTTTGATIYYTTDGTDPKTSGTKLTYSDPFNLTATATVRAIAELSEDWSAEATQKTFTKVTPMTTAAALRSFATSSAQNAYIQLDGWKVTFVSGNNAYIIDPSNEGVILNNASHGYVAGDELNDEVVEASVKLASGRVQLSGFTSTNITATSGAATAAEITDFSTLTLANQSRLVTLKDATYASAAGTFSDGANTIYFYDQFSASPTLVDGATYDVTGIVIYYKSGTTEKVQIAPREATDVVSKGAVVIPTAANLAALKAADRGTYILTLTNAVVTYVNGNNAFIEDATGGALIYIASHGFTAGNCLNGDYQVTTTDHQGKFEITAIEPQAGAATTTAEIPLTTISIATLNANFGSYESMRVKIAGANVTGAISGSDRNGEINDGAAVAVYAAAGASIITLTADDNVDIIGYPGYYNTNQQFNVWQQSDITVNVKDDPELSYSPASVNLTVGDALSAPTFNNPHTLSPITYNTNNDAVATVDEFGAITLVGGTGTAVITASYAGDATYNAGNATFTINVSAADSRKTAVGPAAFTTTSGFLTPSDILFISYKGGASTAPGNYNDGIRLYQISGSNTYGGYTTLIAKKGCKIDEVEITTTNKYATTVGYYVDADEAAIQGETSVAKSGTYNTATGLNADSVRILNLGTGSSGRLEIASITVYYTGDAAAVDHYELGGTYQTEFEIDDAFNHDGLSVYMAYDAGGTEKLDLTAGCTFSDPDMTVAGTPTVEISFGTTVITSYDITVAASTLLDPELSYDPTSVTLTQGDALSAPTFNNPHTLSPITYNSNKPAVATVDEFGVITLAGGTGTATITASFAGDATYQAGNATFTITVNEPEEDLTGTWEFATSVAAGDRIIIASIADAGEVTTMGAQNGNNRSGVASTVAGTELSPAAGSKSVTLVDAGEGKFALQLNNGSYLYAASNTNNYLKETAAYADNENAKWTFAFDGEGVATITAQGTNSHNLMRFNPNSGSPLFNCYTSSSTTGTLVTVYKKDVTPLPTFEDVRIGLSAGNYYTICNPQAMTEIKGGTLWQFIGKDASFAYIEQVSAPFEAGKPYILYATAEKFEAVQDGTPVTVAGENNGLHGTFTNLVQENLDGFGADVYLVIGNQLRLAVGPGTGSNTLPAYRAYVKLSEIPSATPAPGRMVRSMALPKNTPTGIDQITNDQLPMTNKVIIDGQLFIIRGEKMYNANGILVK